ncbi:MAG: DUF2125 domain-containing protein [Alphaproteobacteria bacterium]|nr:DUF2125 domain-containing protein [Alphaproteobacteria bacterium]
MKPAAFSPRTLFIAAVTAVITLSVVGWGLWSVAAAQYRHVVDHWIEEGRAAGYHISYDSRYLFGFPNHVVMRLTNLRWANADGIRFHTDDMDIAVAPWDWTHYAAKFKGDVSLTAPLDNDGHALTLAGANGRAKVTLDKNGVWREAHVSLDGAEVGLAPKYLFKTGMLDASAARPEAPPTDHKHVGLTITGEADDIAVPAAMPQPFGSKAHKMSVSLRVMGPVPDVRRRADVAAWNNASGIVEFDDLSIDWGVLDMTARGTLGFDDDLQPEGAFAGTIANAEATVQALMKGGFIEKRSSGMLTSALNLFGKPAPDGGKGMEFPITVQLGGLFFGPVRIFTFPSIDWPEAPPPVPSHASISVAG